jgi:hypothetical protein
VGASHRVECEAAGASIAFESDTHPLAPSAEAFAGLMLVPALEQGRRVEVDAALDPVWLDGTRRLTSIVAAWWGFPDTYPLEHRGTAVPAATRRAETAACFTGGVDSFYTLLFGSHHVDHLMFVLGYDMTRDDTVRYQAFERSMLEVGRRTGRGVIRLRSDAREHAVFGAAKWDRTHGAALAAAGHLLADSIGTLVIPSSFRADRLVPWGSHPDIDRLWSTQRVAIVHDDHSVGREDKTARIVHDPIVWDHLRVCWENRVPTGNCSRCQKCVRTMISIETHGRRDDVTVFDRVTPMVELIDDLPSIPDRLIIPWRNLLELDLEPATRRALVRLLRRSGPGVVAGVSRKVRRIARRAPGRTRGTSGGDQ